MYKKLFTMLLGAGIFLAPIGNTIVNAKEVLPIVPYWFPQQLLEWAPERDADAIYNKGNIPLAKRGMAKPVNENQSKEAKLMALSIMNQSTSGNLPQGNNHFEVNNFSYWQYVDTLVYWGGSSGEGIIVPPSSDVIDAAHRNGVPVLGTVFFPQKEHGGKLEWLKTALEKNADGSFPFADKLIEVSQYFGFDGWFINQETQGTSPEDAKRMQEFLTYLQAKKSPDMQIVWYDSMTMQGEMDWQNALTDKNECYLVDEKGSPVADSMFLNFWWTYKPWSQQAVLNQSREKALKLGINPYDLYAGIDVQAKGAETDVNWELFAKNGQNPLVSLGVYCPSATYFNASTYEEFLKNEGDFWINADHNPSKVEAEVEHFTKWRGMSNYFVEKTPVTQIPFVTHFNMGNGKAFYMEGKDTGLKNWNNRSVQDVMPTYRWLLESTGKSDLKVDLNYEDAYFGGNSIALTGNLEKSKPSTLKLYATNLMIEDKTTLSTSIKTNASAKLGIVLNFENMEKPVVLEKQITNTNMWENISFDLSAYKDNKLKNISYQVTSDKDETSFDMKLGRLAITKGDSELVDVNDVTIEDCDFKDGIYSDVKLSWKSTKDAFMYQVYKVNLDGTKQLLGVTNNTHYYSDDIRRNGMEKDLVLEVVALNQNQKPGKAASATKSWPQYPSPTGDFKVSETLVAPNEPVTFTSEFSEVTESVEWLFEGADLKTSSLESLTVVYEKEGEYTVTLKVKNSVGEKIVTKKELITVSKELKEKEKNVAINKVVVASSHVSEGEAPKYAVDGKTTDNSKWCAVGDGPHSITIDLGKVMPISKIVIKHAEEGGESSSFNTANYTIALSEDDKAYKDIVKVIGNKVGKTEDSIKLEKGRYVKLIIDKPTQGGDTAARIYEIEVMGIE